ncbi:MAG: arginase, partial [Methylococcaceae bacterium]|nr:arginase [Methylococcaceae bacterium]
MSILQTLGVASCLGGPMRTCGYAAEMLRNEFARQKPEKKPLQLQWHMLYPENYGSKEEKLARLNKS